MSVVIAANGPSRDVADLWRSMAPHIARTPGWILSVAEFDGRIAAAASLFVAERRRLAELGLGPAGGTRPRHPALDDRRSLPSCRGTWLRPGRCVGARRGTFISQPGKRGVSAHRSASGDQGRRSRLTTAGPCGCRSMRACLPRRTLLSGSSGRVPGMSWHGSPWRGRTSTTRSMPRSSQACGRRLRRWRGRRLPGCVRSCSPATDRRSVPARTSAGCGRRWRSASRATSRTRWRWPTCSRPSTRARFRSSPGCTVLRSAAGWVSARWPTSSSPRVARDSGSPSRASGILPSVISPFVIPKIGESNARALFPGGRRFDATRAARIGLVHEIVEGVAALDAAVDTAVADVLAVRSDSGSRRQSDRP